MEIATDGRLLQPPRLMCSERRLRPRRRLPVQKGNRSARTWPFRSLGLHRNVGGLRVNDPSESLGPCCRDDQNAVVELGPTQGRQKGEGVAVSIVDVLDCDDKREVSAHQRTYEAQHEFAWVLATARRLSQRRVASEALSSLSCGLRLAERLPHSAQGKPAEWAPPDRRAPLERGRSPDMPLLVDRTGGLLGQPC